MRAYQVSVWAFLALAACGGNPFLPEVDPGTIDPQDPNVSVNSKFA